MIPGQGDKHPSFKRSFLFAFQGIRFALAQERNIRLMFLGGALAIIAGVLVRLEPLEWAVVLLCCGSVLACELLNTAIETVVDLVSPEFHPLAGKAKDIAAASSWILSLFVALVGLVIYIGALLRLVG